MSFGPCLCGDPYCGSCGPAQGNHKCPSCGRWSADGECDNPSECEENIIKWEMELAEAEAELDKHYEEMMIDERNRRKDRAKDSEEYLKPKLG